MVVYDRFLARIFDSDAADVLLKGGLALELRSAHARATKDVDLRMLGSPDATLERLQELGRRDLGDFLRFEVTLDARHPTIEANGLVYEGRRYRVQAMLAGRPYGRPFGTDIAFAEPILAEPETLSGEPWLDFLGLPVTRVRALSLASHVAEKLHAYTLPRPRPNSRVKDLPDIALLAQTRSLTAQELRNALSATFQHRGTHALPMALPQPPDFWIAPYQEMGREHGLAWTTLGDLVTAVSAFLNPPLAGCTGSWDPTSWRWRDDSPEDGRR